MLRVGSKRDQGYSNAVRRDVLRLVPPEVRTVLSVGCAAGATERALRDSGRRVIGVEMDAAWAEEARAHMDEVIVGDVESLDLPLPEGSVDCILYADVLEHLRRPERVLQRHRQLLRAGGFIVLSVPNMRFWEVVFDLLIRGDWQYTEAGVLDATNLRVFTPRSTVRMVRASGFEVVEVAHRYRFFERTQRYTRLARMLAHGPLRDFFTLQFLVLARKR